MARSSSVVLSAKKLKYLKKPSRPRLEVRLRPRQARRRAASGSRGHERCEARREQEREAAHARERHERIGTRREENAHVERDERERAADEQRVRGPQPPAGEATAAHQLSAREIDVRRCADEREEALVPGAVEQITRREQEPVLGAQAQAVVDGHHREQQQRVFGGVERHAQAGYSR